MNAALNNMQSLPEDVEALRVLVLATAAVVSCQNAPVSRPKQSAVLVQHDTSQDRLISAYLVTYELRKPKEFPKIGRNLEA
jgi:hypothetical protein